MRCAVGCQRGNGTACQCVPEVSQYQLLGRYVWWPEVFFSNILCLEAPPKKNNDLLQSLQSKGLKAHPGFHVYIAHFFVGGSPFVFGSPCLACCSSQLCNPGIQPLRVAALWQPICGVHLCPRTLPSQYNQDALVVLCTWASKPNLDECCTKKALELCRCAGFLACLLLTGSLSGAGDLKLGLWGLDTIIVKGQDAFQCCNSVESP